MRVIFDREAPRQVSLFTGEAWLWAGKTWAAAQGLAVERWAVDRRILCGGQWYAVEWNGERKQWDVRPVE